MEVAYALIADSANVSIGGKLNILGAFDIIFAKEFPCFHPSMVLAFMLRAEFDDRQADKQEISISLINEDSKVLWHVEGHIEKKGKLKPGDFAQIPQIVEIKGLNLQAPGRFRFLITVTGQKDPYPILLRVAKLKK